MATPRKYDCPYCERTSMSPGGVRFHVKMTHIEKIEEFDADHYPAMAELFKK